MRQVRTACTRDCPDACGLIATIEDGRIVRLQGDKQHPVTQGFLCHRTSRFLDDRQYAPHRLTTPLLRKSKDEPLREIGWPEALDLMAQRLAEHREQSGGASIMQYRCGGSMGILKHVGDYFFEKLGPVTVKSGDVCAGAGEAAQLTDFGEFDANDFFDIKHSKTILLWGKNVFVSSVHLIPPLKEARRQGARIVMIDPVRNRTESLSDLVIQPRPGGDAALALGIVRWLQQHDRLDPQASDYCDHIEPFLSIASDRSLSQWAAAADVTSEELEQLAATYAESPSAILMGWGMQRRRFGATTIRVLDALAAVSGNLGVPGGGATFYFTRRGAFDFSFADPDSAPRKIPEPLFGPGVLEASDPPIRSLVVWGANPVVNLPESETVAEAIRTREFSVVIDPFLTDTAQCADLVLPTTTMLEEHDLLGAYGHHYLTEVRPAAAPPEGVRSDYQIFRELAKRLGMSDEFDVDEEVWKRRLLRRVTDAGVDRRQFEEGPVKNPFAKDVLFADRKFATPSGKVNLIHEIPAPLLESADASRLQLAALSTDRAQASQWTPEQQQGPATAVLHPDSAPGCKDGDLVTLRSHRGELQVRLRLDPQQRRDVVLMDKGGWRETGRCANTLIDAELTDDGECAVYYDTSVAIKPVGKDDPNLLASESRAAR